MYVTSNYPGPQPKGIGEFEVRYANFTLNYPTLCEKNDLCFGVVVQGNLIKVGNLTSNYPATPPKNTNPFAPRNDIC